VAEAVSRRRRLGAITGCPQELAQIGVAVDQLRGRVADGARSAATLVALPPAVSLGQFGVVKILGFLGIEATNVAAPWWTYLVVLGVGLLLPPLMALIPLVKTSLTTVRAAIDHHGGAAKPPATTGILARLGRSRRIDRGIIMALRNTFRRPARFLLSAGLLASAGMVFVAGMSLNSGVQAIQTESQSERKWDVDVQLTQPASMAEIDTALQQTPDLSRIEGVRTAETGVAGQGQVPVTRTYPDQGHGGVAVTAIPAGTTTFTPPKLLEGRWLKPGETGAIVLNQIARANTVPGIGVGDTVDLTVGGKATTWRVVGLAEERGGGSGGAYVTAPGFAKAMGQPEQVNQLRIATTGQDEQTRGAVAGAVASKLGGAGIEVRSAASVSQRDASTQGHLGPILMILMAIAIAMAVVGCIGLASTMGANILDRTREFGVMHAIGARPKAVRRIVIGEGVFLALASCVVAAIPALILTSVVGTGLGNLFMYAPLPFRISFLAVAIWVVLVVLGAVLATDAAASRASRITVREALAYL
jgi:putative ABC transport system permease protein